MEHVQLVEKLMKKRTKYLIIDDFRTFGRFFSPMNLVVVQAVDPVSLYLELISFCPRRKIHAREIIAYHTMKIQRLKS